MSTRGRVHVVVGECVARIHWPRNRKPTTRELETISEFVLSETGGKSSLSFDSTLEGVPIGAAVESFALVTRSLGYDVEIDAAPRMHVAHTVCGHVYTWHAWKKKPVMKFPDMGGFLELRECDCGSHCTLESMVFGRDL